MAWIVPITKSVTGLFTSAVELNSAGGVYVFQDVLVVAQSYAIIAGTSNAEIEIYGKIASTGSNALYLGAFDISNHNILTVGQTGQIVAFAPSVSAAQIYGYDNTVNNAGLIYGKTDGLSVFTANATTGNQITNDGSIIGLRFGINNFTNAEGYLKLFNHGTLSGSVSSYVGYACVDFIFNDGTIKGNMVLDAGNDTYNGIGGHVVGTVSGGSGADKIYGGSEANIFHGDAGADNLQGYAGNDTLFGDADNDLVNGGLGADDLYGGTGLDHFLFASIADSTVSLAGRDDIFDFSHAEGDKINLSLIDARSGTVANEAFSYIGTAAFTGVKGQLHYSTTATDTFVSGDINGDKVADFMIHLIGQKLLVPSDFVV